MCHESGRVGYAADVRKIKDPVDFFYIFTGKKVMWFAKWFGGRSEQDDEPARFAPPASRPVAPAKSAQSNAGGQSKTANRQSKSGFDPYNSGSFDRNQAWGRVQR
jgi:hypothetical protein